jgi:ribosomal protein L4
MYKALGIDRSCLFALSERNPNIEKSARNIDRTKLTTVARLNAFDILKHRTLLMTKSGLDQILA